MGHLIEKFKELFGCDKATQSEKLLKAATDRANRIYTIIKVEDHATVFVCGMPASVEWEQHPEALLFRLRDMYVDECMKRGELV